MTSIRAHDGHYLLVPSCWTAFVYLGLLYTRQGRYWRARRTEAP